MEQAREVLGQARSNDPTLPTGREVWDWALLTGGVDERPASVETPLQTLFDGLIGTALSTDLPAAAIAQAVAVIDVTQRAGMPLDLTRAQERVVDGFGRHQGGDDLQRLREALGFAPPQIEASCPAQASDVV